jgi:hypothetical protein
MRSDRRTHRGALLFTAVLAIAALSVVARPLTAPLPSATAFGDEEDHAEPAASLYMRTPLPAELHSRWHTQSVVAPIEVGEITDVTVQFINTGHVEWIRGTPSEIRLGETGPRPLPTEMKIDWPLPNRPAVQAETIVYEDQVATFTFKVGGAAPGTYRLRLRPVVDGVKWLEDDGVYVDITVRSPG